MMPSNYMSPYHRHLPPMPPLVPETEGMEMVQHVHSSRDQMPPRSTHFRVVASSSEMYPKVARPMPGYPSAPHYAPYNMGMRGGGRMAQYQVRAMEERAAAPGLSSPSSSSSSASPPAVGGRVAKKRVRNAWPAEMTRQIINVLLTEFLDDPGFRTTIYRSREERDHRFIPSGRSILEEYNKVQNIRRRYFIPLSYLLQWDELRTAGGNLRGRQRANIEKKLAKPLERSRLEMIFNEANRTRTPSQDDGDEQSKPVFELDIFVSELKSRDPILWARGIAAFEAWVSRKCAVNFILNH